MHIIWEDWEEKGGSNKRQKGSRNGRKTGMQRQVQSIKYTEYHFLNYISFPLDLIPILDSTRCLRNFLSFRAFAMQLIDFFHFRFGILKKNCIFLKLNYFFNLLVCNRNIKKQST